jgi:hypothetical protein
MKSKKIESMLAPVLDSRLRNDQFTSFSSAPAP